MSRRARPIAFALRPAAFALLVLSIFSLTAPPASAHLMSSGLGPFYDGLLHPFVTPEDLLPLIALALLAGLSGARAARFALFAVPLSWGLAMALSPAAQFLPAPLAVSGVILVVAGAAIAIHRPWPLTVLLPVEALAAVLLGLHDGREYRAASAGPLVLTGTTTALFVLFALVGAESAARRHPSFRLVLRIAGSWLTAIGLLMIGWSVRV